MQIKRRIFIAGTTFFLAAATGHIMQNGGAISARFLPGTDAPAANAAATVSPVANSVDRASIVPVSAGPLDAAVPSLPDLPDTAIPALASGLALGPRMVQVERGYNRKPTAADARYSAFGLDCTDPVMALKAKPGGMIGIEVTAPCQSGTRVEVSSAGLVFDVRTGLDGTLRLDIPALATDAEVGIAFDDGSAASGRIAVPEALAARRIAVQWAGSQPLLLDVYENGAAWGEKGHVSAGSDPATGHGAVLSLGDPMLPRPRLALVYSGTVGPGSLAAELSAEVTPMSCGHELAGEVLRPGSPALPVSLEMPACDGAGGYVVVGVDVAPVHPSVSLASN